MNNTNNEINDIESKASQLAYNGIANLIEDTLLNYELPTSTRINLMDKEIASVKELFDSEAEAWGSRNRAISARLRALEQIKKLMIAASLLS